MFISIVRNFHFFCLDIRSQSRVNTPSTGLHQVHTSGAGEATDCVGRVGPQVQAVTAPWVAMKTNILLSNYCLQNCVLKEFLFYLSH